jgi:hypothetical protein
MSPHQPHVTVLKDHEKAPHHLRLVDGHLASHARFLARARAAVRPLDVIKYRVGAMVSLRTAHQHAHLARLNNPDAKHAAVTDLEFSSTSLVVGDSTSYLLTRAYVLHHRIVVYVVRRHDGQPAGACAGVEYASIDEASAAATLAMPEWNDPHDGFADVRQESPGLAEWAGSAERAADVLHLQEIGPDTWRVIIVPRAV